MRPTHIPAQAISQRYRSTGAWRDVRVSGLLAEVVTRNADRVAVIDGDIQISFADLDRHAKQIAAALWASGVRAGDVVTVQLPNRWETVAVFAAIARIGAVMNPVVPIYRGRELAFILRQARTKVAVIPGCHRGFDYPRRYAELARDLPDLRQIVVLDNESDVGLGATAGDCAVGAQSCELTRWHEFLAGGNGSADASDPVDLGVDADDVFLLLYTSGTTADPKGVLHNHNTLVFEAGQVARTYDLDADDVIFNPSPLSHVTGVCAAMLVPALTGSAIVLQDAWDPQTAHDLIRRHGASFMVFSTPFLAGLVGVVDPADPPTTIGNIVCGGADVPDDLTRRATTLLGTVTRMYGLSENPSVTGSSAADSIDTRLLSDGIPLSQSEVRIDPVADQPDGSGEIMVRGPDTMVGYLDASLNAGAFDADGWLHTGDLGLIDSAGALHVTGRIKDVINRSGEKISAHDVENHLAEMDGITDLAVVGGPDPVTGERVCAFLIADGAPPQLAEVAQFLAARGLARQKIPESIYAVNTLPRTASGKIQKFALRNWLTGTISRELAGIEITAVAERERSSL